MSEIPTNSIRASYHWNANPSQAADNVCHLLGRKPSEKDSKDLLLLQATVNNKLWPHPPIWLAHIHSQPSHLPPSFFSSRQRMQRQRHCAYAMCAEPNKHWETRVNHTLCAYQFIGFFVNHCEITSYLNCLISLSTMCLQSSCAKIVTILGSYHIPQEFEDPRKRARTIY